MRFANHAFTRGLALFVAILLAMPALAAASNPLLTMAQTQPQQQPATGAQQPAAPPPVAAQASAPPSTTGQAGMVAVANDTVTYGVDWQYVPDDSNDTAAVFQNRPNPQVIYIYYFSDDGGGVNPVPALEQFDQEFFSDFEPGTVQEVTSDTLPNNSEAWSLYRVDDAKGSLAYLIVVNISPQGTRYQVLSAPVAAFASSLPAAQQGFTINGVAALYGLDPAYTSSFLTGVPAAQAPQPGIGTAGGPASDVAAMDAPTGCDGIGWVVTDPSQMPATQADMDHDNACVGGASYIAACGNYAVDDTSTTIECQVSVAVGSTPMTVSSSQFALVDASGTAYPVDLDTTTVVQALLGVPGLPDGTVAAGTSVTGPVFFTVPATATQPWTIQVAPDTIATTGEQPGVLVIDGQLQNFTDFLE